MAGYRGPSKKPFVGCEMKQHNIAMNLILMPQQADLNTYHNNNGSGGGSVGEIYQSVVARAGGQDEGGGIFRRC